MAVHNIYVNALNNFGNEKQKEEFLRPYIDGKNIGSFSLSEPGTYRLVMVMHYCELNLIMYIITTELHQKINNKIIIIN